MNSTRMKSEGFFAELKANGLVLSASLRGNADMDVLEHLKGFLDDLHRGATAAGAAEVVFHLEELYFMNSSCLSLLLRFINAVSGTPPSKKFRLRFKSNPNLSWQKKSLAALRAYDEDLVVVE